MTFNETKEVEKFFFNDETFSLISYFIIILCVN